jgi:hypothetical protein
LETWRLGDLEMGRRGDGEMGRWGKKIKCPVFVQSEIEDLPKDQS